jgi:hypothetical protein
MGMKAGEVVYGEVGSKRDNWSNFGENPLLTLQALGQLREQ